MVWYTIPYSMEMHLGKPLRRIAEVFPGQNSKIAGMGTDLYSESKAFADVVDGVDQLLGLPRLGSLDPKRQFAPVVFGLAAAKALSHALGDRDPANATALSIGENAMVIRHGIVGLEPTIKGLALREKITEGRQVLDGYLRGMLAVIGINPDEVDLFLKSKHGQLMEGIEGELVNSNSPIQGVLAIKAQIDGRVADIKDVARELRGKLPFDGISLVPLNELTNSFHSKFIRSESVQFQGEVAGIINSGNFHDPAPDRKIFLPTVGKFVTEGYQAFLAYMHQLTNGLDFRKPWEEFSEMDLVAILSYDPREKIAQIIRANIPVSSAAEILNVADIRSFDFTVNALLKNPQLS